MSNNNGEGLGLAIILTGIIMAAYVIAFIVMILALGAAFLSFILTFLCLLAWQEPLKLGKLVIEPAEARAFVYRGLAGAVLLPMFAFFCAVIFKEARILDFLWYAAMAGYGLGSLGFEILMADEEATVTVTPQPMQTVLPPQVPQRMLPPPPSIPFRYASWDDEEGKGR